MKRPPKPSRWVKEIKKVIDGGNDLIEAYDEIGKEQFESLLNYIIDCVVKNQGVQREQVAARVDPTIEAMSAFLQSIDEDERSWDVIITFLYMKFHQELGLANDSLLKKLLAKTR